MNFLKEIKQARNQMQIKEDLPKNDDEDKKLKKFFKKTKIMTLQEVQHTIVRGRTGYEFKPDHNPYCTLLTSDNITDINFALKAILYGVLRSKSRLTRARKILVHFNTICFVVLIQYN